ncbi:hydrolase 2, exosortase A system-associated [Pelomonas sp. KK5]|uniref:hydrolase 2, exosortase A system-associated n=1 Tax=Pelomonas sp. KK5 TaxID=1855730 RepID=UPI00097BC3A0|nr:hydrolase 2, exosortase A system-associated [Pelomonas sp. KK5]
MAAAPHVFFLPDEHGGQRFCIHHPAQGATRRGQVVYVHPFTEEMNKSRRMAALQSRALAAAGFDVLQADLAGCGDSSGDFGDAGWQTWVDDVLRARRWLSEHAAGAPLWFWGLRAGCLLAAEAGQQLDEPVNYCFWQPATSGKLVLQQFLRIKVAAEMMNGANKGLMDELKRQLADGGSIEVAGYQVSPDLAHGMEQSQLMPPSGGSGRVEWLELTTRGDPQDDVQLSPVSARALAQWSAAGFQCSSRIVHGPSFWQTTEIEDAPELLPATVAALTAAESADVA